METESSCSCLPHKDEPATSQSLSDLLRETLASSIDELGDRLSTPGEPNLGIQALRDYLLNCGKMVRPHMFLGAWSAFKGEKDIPRGVLNIAIGIELFHAFILIHDDIIDGSPQRRGKPALHKQLESTLQVSPKAGEHLAIVGGDIIFSYAMEQFLDDSLPAQNARAAARYFLRVMQDTGWGEATEIKNQEKPLETIQESEILRTYYLKTTRYTVEAPLMLGALLAGAGEAEGEHLKRIAKPLGLAFQIENDLHEFQLEDEAATTLCYDLQGGVKTLVLKKVYDTLSTDAKRDFEHHLSLCSTSADSRLHILHEVQKSPQLKALQLEIDRLLQESQGHLEAAPFSPHIKSALQQILNVFEKKKHHSGAVVQQPS